MKNLLTILFCLAVSSVFSQQVVNTFTTINTGSNGLLDNRITSLALGPDSSTVWIATQNGFSLFDGLIWDYMSFDDFYPGMKSNTLLFTDSQHNLWFNDILYSSGLSFLLKYNGDSITEYIASNGYFGTLHEGNLYEDDSEIIYLKQFTGIARHVNDTFFYQPMPTTYNNNNLVRDSWGKLVVSFDNKTLRESIEGWQTILPLPSEQVFSASDGTTWLCYLKTIRTFNEDNLVKEYLLDSLPHASTGSPVENYTNFIEDSQQNIWVRPNQVQGLVKYNASSQNINYYSKANGDLSSDRMTDELLLDSAVWFSSINVGINSWNGNQFSQINTLDGLVENTVNSIFSDGESYYFGTDNGYSNLINNTWTARFFLSDNSQSVVRIADFCKVDNNKLLLSAYGAGLILIDSNTVSGHINLSGYVVPVDDCYRTIEGYNNDFWISHSGGLAHFFGDPTNWVNWADLSNWENFTTADGLPSDTIVDLSIDSNGDIWLATSNGISKYSGSVFSNFNMVDGLIASKTTCIYSDLSNQIWIGSNQGLSLFDGSIWQDFTQNDGLASNQVNCIHQDSLGNMWFGTDNGLSMFNGQSWTTYTVTNGLSNNYVNDVTTDQMGNIWVGTNFGATKLSYNQLIAETNAGSEELLIFPNPAKDKLYISASFTIEQIEIYNTKGQLVRKIDSGELNHCIEIANLDIGNYFIRVLGNGQTALNKFIVIN